MNYQEIIEDCQKRMKWANDILGDNPKLSHIVWGEAFRRMQAAHKAIQQANDLTYKSCGSLDMNLKELEARAAFESECG